MRIHPAEFIDLPTPFGTMRTHLFRPSGTDRYPAVVLFSEIYQMTGPIARTAAFIAGNGFLVAVPEVYHEFATPGEVLPTINKVPIAAIGLRLPKNWQAMTPMQLPSSSIFRNFPTAAARLRPWASAWEAT